MTENNLKFSINIDDWFVNSKGITLKQDWLDWVETGILPQDDTINASAIPALTRRRMSTLSKLAVQTALQLLQQHDVEYLVFASRHGELHRSLALIESIIEGGDASPMAFSQSVHNTAAGLTTIISKQRVPLTSIAAGEDTFHHALLEAWLYLEANPTHKVLVIDFDEPLPERYQTFEQQEYQSFALGLVISHGDALKVEGAALQAQEATLPQSWAFMKHYLTSTQQWKVASGSKQWTWKRT